MPRPPKHSKRRITTMMLKELEIILLAKMESSKGQYFDKSDLTYLRKEAEQYVLGGHTLTKAAELAFTRH